MKPGNYALGSQLSRPAARSLLIARKASEEDQLRFQTVSIVDGSRVNLDGLAERIRAARMKDQGEGLPASLPSERGKEHDAGRRADCLSERITKARERVKRMQDPATLL
jgi:hypothetical protein